MNYHNITHDDMNNGDGLRVVLWVAGCKHHCKGCQNPVTWNPDDGLSFGKKEREEIFKALGKPHIAGITFSGGDPLHPNNRWEVDLLMQKVKSMFPDKTIWVYTGYTWEEITSDRGYNKGLFHIMRNVDVLVDGRYEEELRNVNYPWAGSTNQRVIDVPQTLKEGRVILHESH